MGFNEGSLWQQARQGEKRAFVEIYDRCYPAIFNYVFYRVGDRDQAEDLAAEVFIRMVEKLHTFQPGDRPILAWLYTIAYHLVIDFHRKEARATLVELEENDLSDPTYQPEAQIEERISQYQLVRALRFLNEVQRQVIVLKFVERRSNCEIGSLLGKDEGAIKSIQHRAIRTLRKSLEAEEQSYEPS